MRTNASRSMSTSSPRPRSIHTRSSVACRVAGLRRRPVRPPSGPRPLRVPGCCGRSPQGDEPRSGSRGAGDRRVCQRYRPSIFTAVFAAGWTFVAPPTRPTGIGRHLHRPNLGRPAVTAFSRCSRHHRARASANRRVHRGGSGPAFHTGPTCRRRPRQRDPLPRPGSDSGPARAREHAHQRTQHRDRTRHLTRATPTHHTEPPNQAPPGRTQGGVDRSRFGSGNRPIDRARRVSRGPGPGTVALSRRAHRAGPLRRRVFRDLDASQEKFEEPPPRSSGLPRSNRPVAEAGQPSDITSHSTASAVTMARCSGERPSGRNSVPGVH